jgi:Arc/MetJ family transcription regulator
MRTNIELDDDLIEKLMALNPNLKTKKDAVNFALWNTVQNLSEATWESLVLMEPLAPDYHYKASRTP